MGLPRELVHLYNSKGCWSLTEPIRLAQQYDIKQLPSIKLFREGEFVKNYAGQATEMAFLNFARKELNPGPRLLVTMEEFQSFTDNDDVQVNWATPTSYLE